MSQSLSQSSNISKKTSLKSSLEKVSTLGSSHSQQHMNSGFPMTRMRRTRMKEFSRELVKEHRLTTQDLIQPLFVIDGKNKREKVDSMPGVFRMTGDLIVKSCKELAALGIPAVAIFPVVDSKAKDLTGRESYNPNGLVQRTIKSIKDACPELGVISDIALDPYTTHGQDGIIDSVGNIINDVTVEVLVKQAISHAQCGVDIVAPSDMMDGRIGLIRQELERQGFSQTMILAYSAKYASSFYGPFRDAVGSKKSLGKANKLSYQMDPANQLEAIREVGLDIHEGADIVMVKPGLPYLDIITRIRDRFEIPIFAYNVSGEYAMVKAAAERGWLDEQSVVLESLTCFKRAGANAILTYHAKEAATWLQNL